MYYFIRVNGESDHNNPNRRSWYVEGEPPKFPKTYFNYLDYCIENNVIRIGWPFSFARRGLGSKVSTCEGPPSI